MKGDTVHLVISELIVDTNTTNKELFTEKDGEKFYKIYVHLSSGDIIALVSEFLLKEIDGHAKLKGYLASTVIKEPREHLFTYFNVTEMEPVDENCELTNIVDISGRITKICKLVTLNNGKQILPIVISRMSEDGHTSIIHAVLSNAAARRLNKERDKQYSINASGAIVTCRSTIEVRVTTLTLMERR